MARQPSSGPKSPGPGRPAGNFTQHRRIDRLRELLTKHPRGLSIEELAQALGVCSRSVRRYLKEVERQLDLESVPTRGGGPLLWRVRPGEIPRKLALRRTQAYALLAARRLFEPFRGSALYDEIDIAISGLLDFAQRPGRGPNAGLADARLEDRFLYLPQAPKDYREKTEELDDLFQAVADLRPLSMKYRAAARTKEEVVAIHPYALVLHRSSIYCVGLHLGRGEIRTFLLDRMRDTECSYSERFELPSEFNLDDYFQGELGIWRSEQRHKVVVEFDETAAEYLRFRRIHPTQRVHPGAGGKIRVSMTVGSLKPVVNWVLEWGPRARVLEPSELVEAVRTELASALRQYDPAQSPQLRRRR